MGAQVKERDSEDYGFLKEGYVCSLPYIMKLTRVKYDI